MTASERMDEIETVQAEQNAALAELRRMTEEKKSELENVILRESLATSNERYTTLKTEQDAALQRMNNALNENTRRIENALNNVNENVKRMNAALSENVGAEVSRVSGLVNASAREVTNAAKESAATYKQLFVKMTKENVELYNALFKRRNVIDILVLLAAVLSLGLTVSFWYFFLTK
jgi:uncharacterized coiled-coil protein SlyX